MREAIATDQARRPSVHIRRRFGQQGLFLLPARLRSIPQHNKLLPETSRSRPIACSRISPACCSRLAQA